MTLPKTMIISSPSKIHWRKPKRLTTNNSSRYMTNIYKDQKLRRQKQKKEIDASVSRCLCPVSWLSGGSAFGYRLRGPSMTRPTTTSQTALSDLNCSSSGELWKPKNSGLWRSWEKQWSCKIGGARGPSVHTDRPHTGGINSFGSACGKGTTIRNRRRHVRWFSLSSAIWWKNNFAAGPPTSAWSCNLCGHCFNAPKL